MQCTVKAVSRVVEGEVRQLLDYYLPSLANDLTRIEIAVSESTRSRARPLFHCRLRAVPSQGSTVQVDEQQVELAMAVTRSLDRCQRTLRRQRRHAVVLPP